MDNDGTVDLAVGAPGSVLSSVYILYLNPNATVRESTLIRGEYGNITSANVTFDWIINGPPIHYMSKFGVSLASIGDLDGDNISEIAVGANPETSGLDLVYILYMHRNGTVREYRMIGSNIGGGPTLPIVFSTFSAQLGAPGPF